jgi:ABC-2 type transport system permease protein
MIRMKVAVLRHAVTGARATWMLTGALVGLAVAAGTVAMALFDFDRPETLTDLLAVVFAIWTFAWMLGPAFGGEATLRPEHFALLPIPRRTLALGLLGSAFVGVGTAVSLVGFSALVVFAARLGTVPVVVGLAALALQLTLVVTLSRITARLFGALARSRTGAAVTALITAVLLVLSQSGWVVFIALDAVLETGFSDSFSQVVRALPSSWGLVAVEAAAGGDWVWSLGLLVGLAALIAALAVLWSRLLGPQRLPRPVVRGSVAERAAPGGRNARTPTGAVYVKELRTWWRDPLRVQALVVAPAFAILTALLPLTFGSTAVLPFVGAITALMAAVTCGNLYGQDGTALWLTLLLPGTEEADVRGRQRAWLSLFGPMALVLTVAGAAVHGDADLWPWALAATFAVLGGGAGLLLVVATDQLVPGPDPHEAKNSPLDHPDVTGQSFVMLFLALATAVPALGVVLAGELSDQPLRRWTGVVVGIVTGSLCYLGLGRVAAGRLRSRGPELLYLMRAGKDQVAAAGESASVFDAMPRHRRNLVWTCLAVGCIALFPQALVPTAMKLSGDVAKVWFLALYLPDGLQWPTIAFMVVLAVAAFGLAARIYFAEVRTMKERLDRRAEEGRLAAQQEARAG